MKIYAIFHTIRTGSTLLCEYLRGTGIAGNPVDFCSPHAQYFIPDCPYQKPMTKGFLQSLIEKYSTANGVFGMKVQYMQYAELIKTDQLDKLFPVKPSMIYLTRDDKLKQAISALRTFQDGKFYSFQKERPGSMLRYDGSGIERMVKYLAEQESEMTAYFERNKHEVLHINYEELTDKPKKVVMNVLDYIGIDYPVNFKLSIPKVVKQADDINYDWETKYLQGG